MIDFRTRTQAIEAIRLEIWRKSRACHYIPAAPKVGVLVNGRQILLSFDNYGRATAAPMPQKGA